MFKWGRRRGASVRTADGMPSQWQIVWKSRLSWCGVLFALIGSCAGLLLASQKLLDPKLFPLRHVQLEGELRNLNEADLAQVVERYLGVNFFALDINALRTVLMTNPWIEYAVVSRQWPDTLHVRFRERTIFGYWGRDEMVDINGERFQPTIIRQPGPWPRLAGPSGREMTLIHAYKKAETMLSKAGLQLVELVLDKRRSWWVTVANGTEINLGREHFSRRLQRFVAVYPQLLSAQIDNIAAVDLRYTNGFSVRWREPDSAG